MLFLQSTIGKSTRKGESTKKICGFLHSGSSYGQKSIRLFGPFCPWPSWPSQLIR
jgi:hypothetical protein